MSNNIEIFVEFDFRGKSFRPTATVDLDLLMESEGVIPPLYPLLAAESGIGAYSYELEVMEVSPIQVSHTEGMVGQFVEDGQLNQQGFESAWHQQREQQQIELVARQFFSIDELERSNQLREALQAVYRLGRGDWG